MSLGMVPSHQALTGQISFLVREPDFESRCGTYDPIRDDRKPDSQFILPRITNRSDIAGRG